MRNLVLASVALLGLSGCAGIVAPFVHNPYAGDYSGTFVTSDGKAGPATVQLTNIGDVFGTLTDSASGQTGSMRGSVDSNLNFDGSVTFGSVTHNVDGKFKKSGSTISGTLAGAGGYTFTLTVATKS
jgi:hypothetical protein